MASIIHGLTSLDREPGARLKEDKTGLVTFTESQVGKTADCVAEFFSLTRFLSVCPDFPGLALDDKEVIYDAGGQAHIVLVWAGLGIDSEEEVILPEPVWFLRRTPSEEPIETHPNFVVFAGIPASPLNGAKFDENGLFTGFEIPASPAVNVWGGISKYLEFAAVLTKTSVVDSEPDADEIIPRIDTPTGPGFGVPTISGRTWMKTDFTITQRGSVYEVVEEWTMSGQRGWNTTLYPA
jgi:hypothetical protein